MEEHRLNALDSLEEPNGFVKIYRTHISGGNSNVSFSFRGNDTLGKRCPVLCIMPFKTE
jgi:cobalamin-dependent methionine synthase I